MGDTLCNTHRENNASDSLVKEGISFPYKMTIISNKLQKGGN